MNNKTWKIVVNSTLTTIIGFSNLVIIPSIEAHNQTEKTNPSTDSNNVAKNSPNSIHELLTSKIYPHQWQNQQAITLHFLGIPLITFLGDSDTEITTKANQLALKLEELYQQQIDANFITVSWNAQKQDYTIKYQKQELFSINKTTVLPDTTNNLEVDALQATNRLRRLLGCGVPVAVVQGKPKPLPQVKVSNQPKSNHVNNPVKKNVNNVATAGNKNIIRGSQGIASWYGPGFHGRKTASGERFNQNALTAAHPHLPFGTKVKVTNLRNGNSVVVRINDRGPHIRGRIIDLSAGAARLIGVTGSGTAPVVLQIMSR